MIGRMSGVYNLVYFYCIPFLLRRFVCLSAGLCVDIYFFIMRNVKSANHADCACVLNGGQAVCLPHNEYMDAAWIDGVEYGIAATVHLPRGRLKRLLLAQVLPILNDTAVADA